MNFVGYFTCPNPRQRRASRNWSNRQRSGQWQAGKHHSVLNQVGPPIQFNTLSLFDIKIQNFSKNFNSFKNFKKTTFENFKNFILNV